MVSEGEIFETLKSIGLSSSEAKVYIGLLKQGVCSVTELSRRTKMHRSNVYGVLDTLISKGLVLKTFDGMKNVFCLTSPSCLSSYLKLKEGDVDSILPDLEKMQKASTSSLKVCVFQGTTSLRNEYMNLLLKSKPILAYGISKNEKVVLGKGFLDNFHKERIKKNIFYKGIYNFNVLSVARHLDKLGLTQVRFFDSHFDSKVSTIICGSNVLFVFWNESPISFLIINDPLMAKSYENYFHILWKRAKNV